MQTQQNGHPMQSTTFHSDSGLVCPTCQQPMKLRQISYTARRHDVTFMCVVCAWRTTQSPPNLAGLIGGLDRRMRTLWFCVLSRFVQYRTVRAL